MALSYLAVVAALIALSHSRVPYWWALILAHGLAMLGILGISRLPATVLKYANAGRKIAGRTGEDKNPEDAWVRVNALRYWYALGLIPLTYKELGFLVPLVHPHDYDAGLARLDRILMGQSPIAVLDRLNSPALTLVLQLSYLCYYILPLILAAALWRKGELEQFHFLLFIVVLGFYSSYLGYFAVPAIGPRFFPHGALRPLTGPGVARIQATLNRMEGITRDCFPSGHTELSLVVLTTAWRFHKKSVWVLLPMVTALIFSTVYLRYHYLVDVIAGIVLAAILTMVSYPLFRLLARIGERRGNAG